MTFPRLFSALTVIFATLLLITTAVASPATPQSHDGVELYNIENKQGDFLLMLKIKNPQSELALDIYKALGFKSAPVAGGIGLIGNVHDSKIYLMQGGGIDTSVDAEGQVFVRSAEAYIRNSFEMTPLSSFLMLTWSPSKVSAHLALNEVFLPTVQAAQYKGIYKCADDMAPASRFVTTPFERTISNINRLLRGQLKVERLDQIRHSVQVLVDLETETMFHISEAGSTEPNPASGRELKIHMRHMKVPAAADITSRAKFNTQESSFDSTYFYLKFDDDIFLVVPPDENYVTYTQLLRSLKFFEEAFGDAIPVDETVKPGFSPKLPFIYNKKTGLFRNLSVMRLNPVGSKEGFPNTGRFVFAIGKGAALRLFHPEPELPAGMTRLEDINGVKIFEVKTSDGGTLRISEGPIPDMLEICEPLLTGKKKR